MSKEADYDMNDRGDYIRLKVRIVLEALAQDALEWDGIPPAEYLESEPLWYELRDAVVSVLFDMDREMAKQEEHADYVVKHCL